MYFSRNKTIIRESSLIPHVSLTVWPIVYHPKYNISFFGIEKLHVFDTKKWGKVVNRLIGKLILFFLSKFNYYFR